MEAVLVVKVKINAFIVTLATWMIFRGLVHVMSGGRTPRSLPDPWRNMPGALHPLRRQAMQASPRLGSSRRWD